MQQVRLPYCLDGDIIEKRRRIFSRDQNSTEVARKIEIDILNSNVQRLQQPSWPRPKAQAQKV